MARFTWTYGASEGRAIFINDSTLPNPKESGIAAISCHQIGNQEAERLANLFITAPSMLALLEKALPIIEEEAERRDMAIQGDSDKSYPAGEYWTEMRELADEISAEIDRAYGRTVSDPELCPHGYGFVEYCEDCKKKEVKHGE